MPDTTVYSIFAGYIPTLGFKKDDFKYGRSHGTRRETPQGIRYDGVSRNLTGARGIRRDGSIGMARVRGSIAWYEYSTKVRELEVMVKDEKQLQEWLTEGAKTWFDKTSRSGKFSNEDMMNDFLTQIGIENIAPRQVGDPTLEKAPRAMEEEQPLFSPDGSMRAYKPSDTMDTLAGYANAIDIYIEGRDGDIYRLDVTAMTLDKKGAHHGLTGLDHREKKGVSGKQLMNLIKKHGGDTKKAEARLYSYFEEVRKGWWNPPIVALKKAVLATQTRSADLLRDLQSRSTRSLEDLSRQEMDLLNELRGGVTGAMKESKSGANIRDMAARKGGWQMATDRIREHAIRKRYENVGAYGKGSNYHSAQGQAVAFALHMFGNILEIFRTDSAVQGGYSTGYTMGGGDAANFVVEVMHRISPSGASVFEFMEMKKNEVRIHNEASLSAVYRKRLWHHGKTTSRSILENENRLQNQSAMHGQMQMGKENIDMGAIVHASAQSRVTKAGEPVHFAAAAGMALPDRVNQSIDIWLQNATAGKGSQFKGLQALLKRNIKKTRIGMHKGKGGRKMFGTASDIKDPIGNLTPHPEGNPPVLTEWLQAAGHLDGSGLPFTGKAVGDIARSGYYHTKYSSSSTQAMNKKLFGVVDNPDLNASGDSFNVKFRTRPFADKQMNRAQKALHQAMGGNVDYDESIKYLTHAHEQPFPRKAIPDMGIRGMGASMVKGAIGDAPWEYDFSLPSSPSFWATPYLSLLYPSTQVRTR